MTTHPEAASIAPSGPAWSSRRVRRASNKMPECPPIALMQKVWVGPPLRYSFFPVTGDTMGVVRLANPLKAGDLLVASHQIDEGVFYESVVYLVDVGLDGVLGVIVNQPCAPGTLRRQLPGWVHLATPPQDLFLGGPMSPSGAICLARVQRSSEEPPGWRRVQGLIGLLHLDTPTELVVGAFTDVRIFAGYAEWGPGQLEAELIRGDWIRAIAHPEDVFSSEPRGLWRAVLHRQNGTAAMLATATDTPALN